MDARKRARKHTHTHNLRSLKPHPSTSLILPSLSLPLPPSLPPLPRFPYHACSTPRKMPYATPIPRAKRKMLFSPPLSRGGQRGTQLQTQCVRHDKHAMTHTHAFTCLAHVLARAHTRACTQNTSPPPTHTHIHTLGTSVGIVTLVCTRATPHLIGNGLKGHDIEAVTGKHLFNI